MSLGTAALALGGCRDQAVHVYTIPKEAPLQLAMAAPGHPPGHHHAPQGGPGHLHWELPAGWKEEKPDRLRVASFSIAGEDGKMAQVAVIPLPGVSGIELDSVNMWREELKLPQFSAEEFSGNSKEITVGGAKGHLVEMVAEAPLPDKNFKTRTVGVILPRENTLWFIKMTGEDSLVASQKEKFQSFLTTLEFHASAADHAPKQEVVSSNTGELPATAGLPKWQPPAHWKEKPPGSMVTAAYTVTAEKGKADVMISKLGVNYGGLLPNVQRWQQQLGIKGSSQADLDKVVSSVEVDGQKVSLVDITGTDMNTSEPARTIVIVMPGNGETWFYKIMGSPEVVGKERENLIKFVEEAH